MSINGTFVLEIEKLTIYIKTDDCKIYMYDRKLIVNERKTYSSGRKMKTITKVKNKSQLWYKYVINNWNLIPDNEEK